MRLEDYQQILLDKFMGLWDRGADDIAPRNYFLDCLNVDYNIGEVFTRDGLSTSITLGYGGGSGKVVRFINFFTPAAIVTLILDEAGNLYKDTSGTPLITIAAAKDFSAIQMLGRIYIAFHDGENGLSGENLKVFNPGDNSIRNAAGVAPTAGGAMVVANGAASTLVNAGLYKIAVAYITDSGHLTIPGPEVASVFTPTSYTSPGAVKIDMTSVPTGPAGTSKRQIIITRVAQEEYFFLPSAFGGVIADNVTTIATLDFDDTTDLVDSADYLFDLLGTIPTPLGLSDYHARLITFGEDTDDSILRVSKAGEPESFDSIDGIVVVTKDDGFTLRNAVELRDVFYAAKNLGVHAILDNGKIPSGWLTYPIDKSINVPIHGIAEFFDLSGIRIARDWTLFIDRSGIVLFDGTFRKPPITHYINDLWQTLNFAKYHRSVLVVDEQLHKVYCAIPTGSSTENDLFLVGDYNECPGLIPSAGKIKWSPIQIKPGGTLKGPTEIGLIAVSPDTVPTLKIGSIDGGGKIWKFDPTSTDDDGTAIESFFETSLLYYVGGFVHFFNAIRMRVTGTGNLEITIAGEDTILPKNLFTGGSAIALATSPGKEVLVRFIFTNEKAKIKFRLVSGTKFIFNKIEVFGKTMYQMRPS